MSIKKTIIKKQQKMLWSIVLCYLFPQAEIPNSYEKSLEIQFQFLTLKWMSLIKIIVYNLNRT